MNRCLHAHRWRGSIPEEAFFITKFRVGRYEFNIQRLRLPSDSVTPKPHVIVLDSTSVVGKDQEIVEYFFHRDDQTLLMTTQKKTLCEDGVYTYCDQHQCFLRVKCTPQNCCLFYTEQEMIPE